MNPYGAFTNNGDQIQQWAPLVSQNGACTPPFDGISCLNQLWQVEPVQDTYQSSGQTSLYYDPGSNVVYAIGSIDADYSTQYYYGEMISTTLFDNGVVVDQSTWGFNPEQYGPGQTFAAVYANSGDYYEGRSSFWLSTQYTEQDFISNCGYACGYYYDPFNFSFVASNPEGTDDISPDVTVFGAIIAFLVPLAVPQISLGSNGSGLAVPGPRGAFPLKFRAFIPPAWISGPDPCFIGQYYTGGTFYGGDNRTFDPYSMSYRLSSEATVSATTYSVTGTPSYSAGTSYRYGSDALAPDGYTLYSDSVLHDCHYTDNIVREDGSQQYVTANGGAGIVTANIYGQGTNDAAITGPFSPSIDYNLTLTLNTNQNQYTLLYTHDCFPAYEMYISNSQIYGYAPSRADPKYLAGCLTAVIPQIQSIKTGSIP